MAGAWGYAVYRGPAADNLTLLANTTLTTFKDVSPPDYRMLYYGVAAYDSRGSPGAVRIMGFNGAGAGNCVQTSASLQVSVSLYHCIHWSVP